MTSSTAFKFSAPCEVRFTQDSIKATFQDGRSLDETARQLASGLVQKRDVVMIKAAMHEGHLYSLDNRRLAVFRLLQICGHIKKIKLRVVAKDSKEWKKKFDTKNGGIAITVRGPRYVIGDCESTTTFPLDSIRHTFRIGAARLDQHPGSSSLQSMLLATEYENLSDSDEDDEVITHLQPALVRNCATRATYSKYPLWQGSHKLVAKGSYTQGSRSGDQCVVKWFKNGPVYSDADFDDDLNALAEAKRIVAHFNANVGSSCCKIFVNEAQVWQEDSLDQAKMLVEPFIEGEYRHFNSNTGFQAAGCDLMVALSHFSYHFTRGQSVLCDLQGGCYGDYYVLTDPVILSPMQQYGATDLGQDGIDHFFSQHQCTSYCCRSWMMPPRRRKIFEVREGSSMMMNGRMHYGSKLNVAKTMAIQEGDDEENEIPARQQPNLTQREEPIGTLAVFLAFVFLIFAVLASGR